MHTQDQWPFVYYRGRSIEHEMLLRQKQYSGYMSTD